MIGNAFQNKTLDINSPIRADQKLRCSEFINNQVINDRISIIITMIVSLGNEKPLMMASCDSLGSRVKYQRVSKPHIKASTRLMRSIRSLCNRESIYNLL